jgi:hypothetical protein
MPAALQNSFHNCVHRRNAASGRPRELSTAVVCEPVVDFRNELLFLTPSGFLTEATHSYSLSIRMKDCALGLFSTIPQHLLLLLLMIHSIFLKGKKERDTEVSFLISLKLQTQYNHASRVHVFFISQERPS